MGIRVEEGGDWEGLSAPSLSCSPRDKKGTREKFMKAEAASYSRALGRKEGRKREDIERIRVEHRQLLAFSYIFFGTRQEAAMNPHCGRVCAPVEFLLSPPFTACSVAAVAA